MGKSSQRHTMILPVLLCLLLVSTHVDGFMRVCYYGVWAHYSGLHPNDIDPTLCTHLILAFATLDHDGTTLVPSEMNDPRMYVVFTHVLKYRNPALKTMLAVGGWNMGSELFIKAVKTNTSRADFATNAVKFLREHNFDGLDIYWLYPADRGSGPEDKENYIQLLKALNDEFENEAKVSGKSKLLLSTAVGVSEDRVTQSFDVPNIAMNVDWINMMMYDFHGQWDGVANVHSALYSTDNINLDRFAKNWVAQGAPKDKIVIGIPLYGQQFTFADTNNTNIGDATNKSRSAPYYEICQLIETQHVQEHMLSTERVPYIQYNDTFIGYENVQSITEKARYIRSEQYAGAMVWAINLDDWDNICGNGSYPLLHALKSSLIDDP